MLTLALMVILNSNPAETPCARVTRLDGVTVTTCNGRVAMVRKGSNVREYMLDGTIIVRSEGTVPMVLSR